MTGLGPANIFNCQTARASEPQTHVTRLRACATARQVAPVLCPAWGCRSSFAFRLPKGGAERLGVSPHPRPRVQKGVEKDAHELLSNADPRLRSARNGFCGLLNAPGRRHCRRLRPVRASCRPGTHLDRSPVLPASVPCLRRGLTLGVEGPASWRPSHPAPRFERRFERALTSERDNPNNIPSVWENQFLKGRKLKKPVDRSVGNSASH